MREKVTISHEDKLITSVFSGKMVVDDMQGYFEKFLAEIPEGAQYHERVDFTAVNRFDLSYNGFSTFSRKAAEVFMSGRVAVTEFIVANELQMGMARMFSSMAENGDVEFVFTTCDRE